MKNIWFEIQMILGWCFVDWNLNLNKQASAQGILLYALSAAIRITQVLGEVLEEEKLAELYCECRNAANVRLWDKEKQCYISKQTNICVSALSQFKNGKIDLYPELAERLEK